MSEPQHVEHHHGDGVRLELKPDLPRTGFVDGGWWPRSRDLRAELTDLVAAVGERVGERVGPVERVGFGRSEWDPTGRERLVTPTGRVAFGGFDVFEPDTVWIVTHATAQVPLVLAVVPPDATESHARSVLARASAADNTETAAELAHAAEDGAVAQGRAVEAV